MHLGREARVWGLGLLGQPPCTSHSNRSSNPSSHELAAGRDRARNEPGFRPAGWRGMALGLVSLAGWRAPDGDCDNHSMAI